MDQEPSPTGVRQGQCLSNFRCSRWMMKLILCIVIIILSFIWRRIEPASQKISEHRAIVMLFCDIFVSLCVCVCVCVHACTHMKSWYQAVLSRNTVNSHLKSCTSKVICFSASGVGNLLKFTLNPIFWKLIHCWSCHLQNFLLFHRLSFCFFF